MYIYIYMYIFIFIFIYLYIYVCICRERARERGREIQRAGADLGAKLAELERLVRQSNAPQPPDATYIERCPTQSELRY